METHFSRLIPEHLFVRKFVSYRLRGFSLTRQHAYMVRFGNKLRPRRVNDKTHLLGSEKASPDENRHLLAVNLSIFGARRRN